jgi:hypothetical protein
VWQISFGLACDRGTDNFTYYPFRDFAARRSVSCVSRVVVPTRESLMSPIMTNVFCKVAALTSEHFRDPMMRASFADTHTEIPSETAP